MVENLTGKKPAFFDTIYNLFQKDEKGKLLIAILVIIVFCIFLPCLSNSVVFWDDPDYLFTNKSLENIGSEWSWKSIGHIFTSEVGANYNPLPVFTYAAEKYFFSQDPVASTFMFHFDNLLLHIGTTVCVFILLTKLGLGKSASFLGALLFGIHPMRVESVAWVTERKDVLYGMFYVMALITYVNFIQSGYGKKKWYFYTILWSVVAYFSKIQTVSLPLSMLVMDYYFGRKWYAPKTLILEKLPWWVLSLACALVNLYFLNKVNIINNEIAMQHYSIIDKLAVGAYAYCVYLVKFVFPYQMLVLYPFPYKIPILYFLALGFIPLFVYLLYRLKNKNVVFGVVFFTFNVMFLLQVVSAGRAYLADRFTYIAYIGLFFIVAKTYEWFTDIFPAKKILVNIALAAYLSVFAVITFNQIKVWKNTETLWQHYTEAYSDDYTGFMQLGALYQGIATAFDPNVTMGKSSDELMRLAIDNFKMAILKDSLQGRHYALVTANIYESVGSIYAALSKVDTAAYYFSRQIFFDPSVNSYTNIALLYYQRKQYALTIPYLNQIIRIDPKSSFAFHRRALCEGYTGHPGDALLDINMAIKLQPNDPKYFIVRSQLYRRLNNVAASKADAQKAKEMGGNVPPELLN